MGDSGAFRGRHLLQPSVFLMQDEEACHVKKQMRDIPETLQDKMGQKMRLTVNGLLSGPLPDCYLQNRFVFVHENQMSLCLCIQQASSDTDELW